MGVDLGDVLLAIGERRLPGDRLVHDAAEGVDVGAGVDAVAADLLRRHVVERADEGAGAGQRPRIGPLVEPLGQAEVGQVGAIAGIPFDENVAGLDVAMDQPSGMGDVERRCDLLDDRDRPIRRQRAAGDQHPPQIRSVDEVHGHEQQAVLLAGVVDRDDVRVAQRDGDPRLGTEALAEGVVCRQPRRDHLQGDDVIQRQVGGAIDGAHAAATRDPLDPVSGESGSRIQVCHGLVIPPPR